MQVMPAVLKNQQQSTVGVAPFTILLAIPPDQSIDSIKALAGYQILLYKINNMNVCVCGKHLKINFQLDLVVFESEGILSVQWDVHES